MKYIFWTCDVEVGELAKDKDGAFDTFVLGKIDGETVGVPLLRSIAHEYGAKISWFIDVYPPKYEKNIADLCYKLKSDGESIGLHTHPDTRFDKRRFMYEYSLSEQERIIDFGQRFFYEMTGNEVKFHRASLYRLDDNTFIACKKAGILFDSSFYYSQGDCKLGNLPINAPCEYKGIIEIPVTVYEKTTAIRKRTIFQKLDFRYGSSPKDILEVIKQMPDESYIVLFLHSFNFLRRVYDFRKERFTSISIDPVMIKKFRFLLERIREDSCCAFKTFDDLNVDKLMEKKHLPYYCHLSEKLTFRELASKISNKFMSTFLRRVKV